MQNDITQQNIPIGWKQTTLGEIASITNGSTNTQDAVADGTYPLFDRSVEIKKSSKYLFDDTAIILPGEGAEFVPKIYSGKFDLHQRAYAIFPNKSTVNTEYLYHFLYANRKDFAQKSVGSTVRSLRLPLIQSVRVIIPPIKEQQKIAEILGTVDEDIAKTQEVIKASEKLKRGLMQQLFTRGVDDVISELELCQISKVTSSKRIMRSEYVEDGVPFYRSKEVIEKAKGIKHNSVIYISQERFDEIEKKFGAPHIGDILITAVGTIGVVYLVDEEGFYFKDGNLLWIKDIDKSLNKSYLKYYMNSEIFQKRVLGTAIGSNQKALTIEKVEKVIVSIPKLSEQQKIAEILSAVDEKISLNKKLKEKLTFLKIGLMQDLLSGKVRTM